MNKFKFKTALAEDIFLKKYAQGGDSDSWPLLAERLVEDVCGTRWGTAHALMGKDDRAQLQQYITDMKFIPGGRYLYYCFDPNERILRADYTWDKASNIQEGDTLVGFDETIRNSKFKNTKVTFVDRTIKLKYRVTTTQGSVIVSEDHQFVAKKKFVSKKRNEAYRWIKANELKPGNVISFSAAPWEVQTSYDAGWLAGFMDGEGTVSKGSISMSQKPGAVLDNAIRILTEYGINFYVLGRDIDTVKTICIRGRWESIKVLGMFRPIRLLNNWSKFELGSFWSRASINPPAEVIAVDCVGEGEVCVIETDTHTLIGNGFLSHNCGKPAKFMNNCFIEIAREDTREEWAALCQRVVSELMVGGGVGVDYSILRASGKRLARTGGVSSGPIPLMKIMNEIGRNVMQGGSRRSALFAGLNWQHDDIEEFVYSKDRDPLEEQILLQDQNYPMPLDMTNISIRWDDDLLTRDKAPSVWYDSIKQMCKTGEPGHTYNFGNHSKEIGRNACGEFISERSSDVCNLGSLHLGEIKNIEELRDVVALASKFLICGTIRAELPHNEVRKVREEERKIGLGLMGVHEWLLQRNYKYELNEELKEWLLVYKTQSEKSAKEHAERLFISPPKRYRAVAPAGTLSLLASTSSGLEPLFATSYRRRYLRNNQWSYQYVIEPTAKRIIDEYGVEPDSIETSMALSKDVERRIAFQAGVQDYVDMGISSTINLPAWGTEWNNEDTAVHLAEVLLKYAPRLRGITCYPDGSRAGQPLEAVPYGEALRHEGLIYEESDDRCKGGICGI